MKRNTESIKPTKHFEEEPGILDIRSLPDNSFDSYWNSIFVGKNKKNRILSQAVLTFTAKGKLDRGKLPLHGVILLKGPPGTGKTSLAKGLASRTAASISGMSNFQYMEVDPHELTSARLGQSQQAVQHLLGTVVADFSTSSPLIVLLDEVETLACSRSDMSLEANPVDVHRATDAVLTQLDYLGETRERILFIATSNFPGAIDEAFLSRVDLIEEIGLPDRDAAEKIIRDATDHLIESFPNLDGIKNQPEFKKAVDNCVGLDGREIRKSVVHACARRKKTAMDPSKLKADDILKSVEHLNNRKNQGGQK